MADHEKLREALEFFNDYLEGRADEAILSIEATDTAITGECSVRELRRVIAAAESTLPRTKMVEVWRVEWATPATGWSPESPTHFPTCHTYPTRQLANERAEEMAKAHDRYRCVKVTGPHRQEVPE